MSEQAEEVASINDWSGKPKERARFWASAKALGYDSDGVHATLGVPSIHEYPDNMGTALNYLREMAAGHAQAQPARQDDAAGTINGEIVVIDFPDGSPELSRFGDLATLEAMACRARRFFPWASLDKRSPLDDVQVLCALQYAYLIGANPANEVHAWHDPKANCLVVTPDYGYYLRRAKEQDPGFTFWFERVPDGAFGISPGDEAVTARGQTTQQQETMLKLVEAGMPYEVAAERYSFSHTAVVRKAEMTKVGDPPKGWTWATRAETRAMRGLVKRAFGNVAVLTEAAQGRVAAAELPALAVEALGGEVAFGEGAVRRLAAEAAAREQAEETPDKRTPEEVLAYGRRVLRGDEAEMEGEPRPEEAEQPPQREPEPPEKMRANLRSAAGWEGGRKESDATAEPPSAAVAARAYLLLKEALRHSPREGEKSLLKKADAACAWVFGRPLANLTVKEVVALGVRLAPDALVAPDEPNAVGKAELKAILAETRK